MPEWTEARGGSFADDQAVWADAAVDDDVEVMSLLLESRPQLLDARLPLSDRPALLLAAAWDAHRAVSFLLERGADVDAADADGNTALHLAAAANARRSMAQLVAPPLRPAVDQRNCEGETPLLLGARAGAAECCALLLSPGGADASLRLHAAPFATATDLALRGRHPTVVAALRRWGGA